jgi:hypothetical protein
MFFTGLAHAPRPGCGVLHLWCKKILFSSYNILIGNVPELSKKH